MSAKLNILKTIQSNRTKEIQESNKANIYCEDSAMYLDINGIPFSIEIVYKGSIYLESNLGLLFRINYASNKITIINAFASQFPKKLFDYKGDIKIIDCQILNYSGGLYKADFKNNALQDLLESQDTKVEDDTLIIRGEQKRPPLPMRTGKASINLSDRNKEKLDKDQLLTIIPKFAEYRRKTAVGKQRVTTPAKKIIKKETIKKEPTKTGGKY